MGIIFHVVVRTRYFISVRACKAPNQRLKNGEYRQWFPVLGHNLVRDRKL